MAVLNNTGIRAGASGAGGDSAYQIEKSLRFNKDDDASLSRTFASAGDQEKFTVSFWFKNCDADANNYKMFFCLDNGGVSNFSLYGGYLSTTFYSPDGSSWAVTMNTSTTYKFRDPSAWYHIVLSIDTSAGSTNADRQKIYINGEQLTLTFTTYWDGLMTGDVDGWNTADEHFIGMRGSSYGGNWLAAEYHFVDGTALDADSFGETNATTGQWVPIEYTGGSYGTNGFYLKFDNTSDLGEDSSGQGNDWTVNNLSTTAGTGNDSLTDTPTPFDDGGNGTGNYATLNSLHKGANATLSNGNLQLVNTTTWGTTIPTIGVSSGKWYAEVTLSGTITYPAFGVSSIDGAYVTSYMGQDADSYAWFAYSGGGLYTAADYTDQTGDWVVDCAADDVIGLALDMDNGTLKYYKDGTLLGDDNAFTGITGTQFFATCGYSQTEDWNFGQRPFASTPPTDYLALNTYNLDDTEILSGEYEGNADTDGPVVWMNATPATLKIDTTDPATTTVAFDPDDVDPLAGGFKIRNSSDNNGSGTTYYWLATTDNAVESAFKYANAQTNE